MPRRLLRDGHIVDDDWRHLAESPADGENVILPLEQWLADKDRWLAYPGRLGVVLLPADKVEVVAGDLTRFALLGAEFPGPSEGRGYTQGRLLRERHRFTGELRATGYVRRDQLFFLARCGFNSFELPENELATATDALSTFTAEYQPSNDRGLTVGLEHRDFSRPGG